MEYKVDLKWDDEADVWIATSDDAPGLILESGSLDALIERVKNAIPELLELNKIYSHAPIHFVAEKLVEARI